jgi:ferritin-like protein
VAELRNALLGAVTPEDVEQIIAAIVKAAKKGDVVAAREVLDRTVGKPSQTEILQRLEALEAAVQEARISCHPSMRG